jgi:hypothetical protein
MQYARINTFSGLNATDDTTNAPQNSLAVAENIFVRPAGALRRAPAFSKLWNMQNLRSYVEDDLGLGPGDGVVLLKVQCPQGGSSSQRMTVLVAYDCENWTTQGCFFVGRADGSIPTTDDLAGIAFPSTPGAGSDPILERQFNVEVIDIITGLAAGKRMYFSRIYSEIWIGNGVDQNWIYNPSTEQIRPAGTNSTPSKPLVGSVLSLPAAAAVQPTLSVVTAGTTVVTTGTTTTTTGTSTLTFTADPINFSGTAGQNIRVRIIPSGLNTSITSTRTGAGTAISPFIYTLTLGTTAPQSSADAIRSFVAGDYNATGVLSVSVTTFGPDANPALTLATTALTGGSDAVVAGGHPPNSRYRFAATLFDPGPFGVGLGYEGPAGALSDEVIGTGANDFTVTVAQQSGAGIRFTKQNIWMREYLGPSYPINPDGPFVWRKIMTVNNANGSYRITKNFDTLEVSDEAPAQGVIPPCTMFEFAGDRVWASGNAAEPYRIWLSKLKTETEQVPEGCDITSYLDIEGKKDEPSRPRITALNKIETRVQVHTDRSITMIEGSTLNRIVSRSDFGAINPACLAAWSRPEIVYLGSDGVFYKMVNSQYYRSQPAADTGWPIMRKQINIPQLVSDPQKCNMLADATNNIVMAWLPVTVGGDGFAAFALDLESNALTGPIEWPRLLSCSPVSSGDSKYVGCDYNGDLFVFNLGAMFNDQFSSNSAFQLRENDTQPTYQQRASGLPIFFIDDETGRWLSRGFKCVFETQYLDFQTPNERKGFYTLEWTVARYTRAIIKIILTSDDGHTQTFDCGEMYGRERNKIAFMISGNAIKVRFEAIVAEDKPFIVRDLTIGYELQTNAGGFFF